jgi:hypothetical protein
MVIVSNQILIAIAINIWWFTKAAASLLMIYNQIRCCMEDDKIQNWEDTRERLRKAYPTLTTDDLIYEIGKEEELLERLQKKLDKNKKEIRKWLSWMG